MGIEVDQGQSIIPESTGVIVEVELDKQCVLPENLHPNKVDFDPEQFPTWVLLISG